MDRVPGNQDARVTVGVPHVQVAGVQSNPKPLEALFAGADPT